MEERIVISTNTAGISIWRKKNLQPSSHSKLKNQSKVDLRPKTKSKNCKTSIRKKFLPPSCTHTAFWGFQDIFASLQKKPLFFCITAKKTQQKKNHFVFLWEASKTAIIALILMGKPEPRGRKRHNQRDRVERARFWIPTASLTSHMTLGTFA